MIKQIHNSKFKTLVLVVGGGIVGGVLAAWIVSRFLVRDDGSAPVLPVAQRVESRQDAQLDLAVVQENVVFFVRVDDKAVWATREETQAVGLVLSADGIVATASKLRTAKTLRVVGLDRMPYYISGVPKTLGPLQTAQLDVERNGSGFRSTPFAKIEALHAGDIMAVIAPDSTLQTTRLLENLGPNPAKDQTESSEGIAHFLMLEKIPVPGSLVFTGQGALAGIVDENGNAVPAEFLMPMVRQFLKQEKLTKTYLGASGVELSRVVPLASDFPKYGFLLKNGKAGLAVAKSSPAAKAGLKAGDVIINIEGERIGSPYPLQFLLTRYAPGVEVELGVLRKGKEEKVKVVLDAK